MVNTFKCLSESLKKTHGEGGGWTGPYEQVHNSWEDYSDSSEAEHMPKAPCPEQLNCQDVLEAPFLIVAWLTGERENASPGPRSQFLSHPPKKLGRASGGAFWERTSVPAPLGVSFRGEAALWVPRCRPRSLPLLFMLPRWVSLRRINLTCLSQYHPLPSVGKCPPGAGVACGPGALSWCSTAWTCSSFWGLGSCPCFSALTTSTYLPKNVNTISSTIHSFFFLFFDLFRIWVGKWSAISQVPQRWRRSPSPEPLILRSQH